MTRYAVSLELVNLTETERDVVNSFVAVMADPGLRKVREQFVAGRIALVVEDGEVVLPSTRTLAPQEVGK
jgi:hypothetical protein